MHPAPVFPINPKATKDKQAPTLRPGHCVLDANHKKSSEFRPLPALYNDLYLYPAPSDQQDRRWCASCRSKWVRASKEGSKRLFSKIQQYRTDRGFSIEGLVEPVFELPEPKPQQPQQATTSSTYKSFASNNHHHYNHFGSYNHHNHLHHHHVAVPTLVSNTVPLSYLSPSTSTSSNNASSPSSNALPSVHALLHAYSTKPEAANYEDSYAQQQQQPPRQKRRLNNSLAMPVHNTKRPTLSIAELESDNFVKEESDEHQATLPRKLPRTVLDKALREAIQRELRNFCQNFGANVHLQYQVTVNNEETPLIPPHLQPPPTSSWSKEIEASTTGIVIETSVPTIEKELEEMRKNQELSEAQFTNLCQRLRKRQGAEPLEDEVEEAAMNLAVLYKQKM